MEWFIRLVRIAGASFPGASSLVQFQSELSAIQFENRLKALEDPGQERECSYFVRR